MAQQIPAGADVAVATVKEGSNSSACYRTMHSGGLLIKGYLFDMSSMERYSAAVGCCVSLCSSSSASGASTAPSALFGCSGVPHGSTRRCLGTVSFLAVGTHVATGDPALHSLIRDLFS